MRRSSSIFLQLFLFLTLNKRLNTLGIEKYLLQFPPVLKKRFKLCVSSSVFPQITTSVFVFFSLNKNCQFSHISILHDFHYALKPTRFPFTSVPLKLHFSLRLVIKIAEIKMFYRYSIRRTWFTVCERTHIKYASVWFIFIPEYTINWKRSSTQLE